MDVKKRKSNPKRIALRATRQAAIDLKKKAYKASLDHFCFTDNDGNIVGVRDNKVCYATFRDVGHIGCRYFITLHLNGYYDYDKILTDEEKIAYHKWLFQESMFAPAFHYKDPKRVLKELPAVIDCDYSPRFVMHAAVLCRYRIEHPRIVKMWNKFVNAGVKPSLALFLAQHYTKANNWDGPGFIEDYNHHNTNHIVLQTFSNFNVGRLKSFLLGVTKDDDKGTVSKGNFYYWNMNNMFPVHKEQYETIEFPKAMCECDKKAGGWGGVEVPVYGFRWDEFDKFLSEFLKINKLEEVYEKA